MAVVNADTDVRVSSHSGVVVRDIFGEGQGATVEVFLGVRLVIVTHSESLTIVIIVTTGSFTEVVISPVDRSLVDLGADVVDLSSSMTGSYEHTITRVHFSLHIQGSNGILSSVRQVFNIVVVAGS